MLAQFAPHSFGSFIMRIVLGVIFATGCTTALAQSADIDARISESPALSVMTPQGGLETPEMDRYHLVELTMNRWLDRDPVEASGGPA